MKIFKKIPRNVFLLGIVSLFNDIAAEMIYPIVPIFLTTVLGAPIAIVGLIEGIAEATASSSKFLFGALSDFFHRRKIFVVLGYSAGTISKILIAVATSWPFVLFARFIDRLGKGLRTAPRDSLLLQSAKSDNRGFIFGFHRALDSAGAVFGPLFGLFLLYAMKENLRQVFFLAFIPSAIAVLILIFFISEKKDHVSQEYHLSKMSWQKIHPHLKWFLLISFVFALGNSSDAFIILRIKGLGFSTMLVVLSYVFYNLSQSLFATPMGSLADKIGARKVFSLGLLIFSAVYFFFGLIKNPFWFWLLLPIYGLYIALTDGVSKAYIAEFIAEKESGTYFGLQQTLISIGNFFASFFAGILWSKINPSATFFYGSAMALLAFLLLSFFQIKKKNVL